jgi:peptidoglycan-associated lipoprotein
MKFRSLCVIGAMLLLAACQSAPQSNNGAGGAGGTAATSSVVPGSREDFVQNVGDRVFFDFDSSAIKPEGEKTLERQAMWLKKYSNVNVTIEGHCDDRGTREYNLALGARRAETVREYLVSRGIAASRMRTISYGKERPVALCNDISCWSQNRRAVTVLDQSS